MIFEIRKIQCNEFKIQGTDIMMCHVKVHVSYDNSLTNCPCHQVKRMQQNDNVVATKVIRKPDKLSIVTHVSILN